MKSVICFLSIVIITLIYSCVQVNDPNNIGTFEDSRDNQVYKWVRIGNQVWMAENLAYKPSEGNYWAYNNDPANIAVYGYLYDWETANKVCPSGWHLPSATEWKELIDYLGGEKVAGGKLKETGTRYWNKPNRQATNKTGFSALPGGGLYYSGPFSPPTFSGVGNFGHWWSAKVEYPNAWTQTMMSDEPIVSGVSVGVIGGAYNDMRNGYSVRCVRN